MIAFVKDVRDWTTMVYAEPLEFDAPLISSDNAKGTFTFLPTAPITRGCEGNWLVYGGNLWIIDRIQPTETEITVTVKDAFEAFYRSHVFASSGQTTQQYLLAIFVYNYADQEDTEYAMPYLSVSSSGATPLIKPTLTNDLIFKAADYFREVSQRGVRIQFTPTTQGINIKISAVPADRKTVLFNDGQSQLINAEFSADTTSKVTTIASGGNTFYYLQADGSVATSPPSPRIPGKWQTIIVGDTDDPGTKAAEIFARNIAALQVEFYSAKDLAYGDLLRVKLPSGEVFETAVTYKAINSEDDRWHYKAGNLPVTLTEKLRLILGGGGK